jgi:hypothetical protein
MLCVISVVTMIIVGANLGVHNKMHTSLLAYHLLVQKWEVAREIVPILVSPSRYQFQLRTYYLL